MQKLSPIFELSTLLGQQYKNCEAIEKKMKSKNFNVTKNRAFEVCKKTLKDFECAIISTDFSSGTINAKKGGGLLSFGHEITVNFRNDNKENLKISVSSNSVGVQIIDWGTNTENENELIELISNSLR